MATPEPNPEIQKAPVEGQEAKGKKPKEERGAAWETSNRLLSSKGEIPAEKGDALRGKLLAVREEGRETREKTRKEVGGLFPDMLKGEPPAQTGPAETFLANIKSSRELADAIVTENPTAETTQKGRELTGAALKSLPKMA